MEGCLGPKPVRGLLGARTSFAGIELAGGRARPLACQIGEHHLGDVFGQGRIAFVCRRAAA